MNARSPLQAVFFDLDGTLVDSAPDLIVALDRLLSEHDRPASNGSFVSGAVSKGGRAIIRRGFPDIDEARVEALLPRYLDIYNESIAVHTRLYPGMNEILEHCENTGLRWGIVTNKAGWLARRLVAELGLDSRCAALVSGDCLPVRKPDPAPLLRACELAGVSAARCLYVGDDRRDVEAGAGAGMRTVVAAYGYVDGEDVRDWGADFVIDQPSALLPLLALA